MAARYSRISETVEFTAAGISSAGRTGRRAFRGGTSGMVRGPAEFLSGRGRKRFCFHHSEGGHDGSTAAAAEDQPGIDSGPMIAPVRGMLAFDQVTLDRQRRGIRFGTVWLAQRRLSSRERNHMPLRQDRSFRGSRRDARAGHRRTGLPGDDRCDQRAARRQIPDHSPGTAGTSSFTRRNYLGIEYSAGIVFIQITLNQGRSVEMKKAFYRRVADDLHSKPRRAAAGHRDQPGRGAEENWVVRQRRDAVRLKRARLDS